MQQMQQLSARGNLLGGSPQDPTLAAGLVGTLDGANATGGGAVGAIGGGLVARSSGSATAAREKEPVRVNLTTLLLTLLEMAGGMAYLHRMGVVHCDLKPANVLLKSSSVDRRGFTAKISDFGLSRCASRRFCVGFACVCGLQGGLLVVVYRLC